MSLASAPFLFLLLPATIGVYYLIPKKNGLQIRNIFLLLASLFFYTWGEPILVFLLAGMVVLTWLFGKMAYGKRGTATGKTAVALTVVINLTVILFFGKNETILNYLGNLFEKDLSYLATDFPIGFSFFLFSSISYVVDIYRGQRKYSDSILQTALYTCVFFKILQGPIITYRKFEPQITERKESFDLVAKGIWRFSIGLGKKIIIADNLNYLVKGIFSSDLYSMPFGDAWLGCIAYLVFLYFDFSGYSDMAIGLAEMFGFSIPENFNYPYISKSIAEFWRRFHITLCAWFTEYLYYPILLGPSVRLRKYMLRHKVRDKVARTFQAIFVPASVWLVTALWHGINLNYAIWGLANCSAMLIETHIKPIGNKWVNAIVRHAGVLIFLFLSMPLISIKSFQDSILYYRAMFSGALECSAQIPYYIQSYGVFLLMGIIGCFPLLPYIKEKIYHLFGGRYQKAWDVCTGICLMAVVIISLSYLFTRGSTDFLYLQ